MNQVFYISPKRFIPGVLFGTLVLGSFALGAFVSGGAIRVAVALVPAALLLGLYGFAVWRCTCPVVEIRSGRPLVRRFARTIELDDVPSYELVISVGWLAFRKDGAQDIMLDEHELSASAWAELVQILRRLPFARVLESRSNKSMQPTCEDARG
jgi:hypothetical protein